MIYYTIYQPQYVHQMTIEELFSSKPYVPYTRNNNACTFTYEMTRSTPKMRKSVNTAMLGRKLTEFNARYAELREAERHSLYHSFSIPKKSGGLRKIDAPLPELMAALRELRDIFENDFHALYHTTAFAYVKGRSNVSAIKKHQQNNSKWFAKFDLANFFNSTTPEFVMQQLSMIFPFCEVVKSKPGKEALATALDLCFLDGGLPQGTPISPLLTNLIMIPFDHRFTRYCREHNLVYTRYADDFIISSKYTFDHKEVEATIIKTLQPMDAPFSIKKEKTRYGSSSGSNWNLGVMLNKDNEITIGHKKKRQFEGMLLNYISDHENHKYWSHDDLMTMHGY